MHKLYMHHGVALLSGRANRSGKLGWQKEIYIYINSTQRVAEYYKICTKRSHPSKFYNLLSLNISGAEFANINYLQIVL